LQVSMPPELYLLVNLHAISNPSDQHESPHFRRQITRKTH
jgi:hypothetical protein